MYKLCAICYYLFAVTVINAQLQEDFTDGDFSNNPTWIGLTDKFRISTGELQLFDSLQSSSNTSYLFTSAPTSNFQQTTWEFSARLDFSPSQNNFSRIYLTTSDPNPNNFQTGYYIKFGGISGNNDAIELYRQDGASSVLLISGTAGAVGTAPAIARIKVTRSTNGDWELFADYTGGTAFLSEGNANDLTYPNGQYFGVVCRYTSTRNENFFFDNIFIDSLFMDDVAPILLSVSANTSNEVLLEFDEALEQMDAENISNYSMDNSAIILNATLNPLDNKLVTLTLDSNLLNGINYTVTTNNLKDINGNIAGIQSKQFFVMFPELPTVGDVIFTEIMADPSPVIALPDAEYLELYNNSTKIIDLDGMELCDNSNSVLLDTYILQPGEYVLLCDDGDVGAFSLFGVSVLPVQSLPSLTNSGEKLSLVGLTLDTIDQLSYSLNWYTDPAKENGGWSLEIINPDLRCRGEANWTASNALEGGSPGIQNSVYNDTPDGTAPILLSADQLSHDQILLVFNETLDTQMLSNSDFTIDGSIVTDFSFFHGELNQVVITSAQSFVNGSAYSISIDVQDCAGNSDQSNISYTYHKVEEADRYDIIINEFLADGNPQIGLPEDDFIELYNRSGKIIDLQGFKIYDKTLNPAVLNSYLLFPDSFLIVHGSETSDFSTFGSSMFIADFPELNSGDDGIILEDARGEVIDVVYYTDDWYRSNGKREGGWSLERISPEKICEDESNWIASNNFSGGSPGRVNSEFIDLYDTGMPDLIRVFPLASDTIRLYFSEAMDNATAESISNYQFSGGLVATSAVLEQPLQTSVKISFDVPLVAREVYSVRIIQVQDCNNNPIGIHNTAKFALPQAAEEGDIVINEILFNPVANGADYVELYNKSGKAIDLSTLIIANMNTAGGVEQTERLTKTLLLPGEYIAYSERPSQVIDLYQPTTDAVLELDLPSYPDDEGRVILFSGFGGLGGVLIDQIQYSSDFHISLLNDENGASLERINPFRASNDPNNWHTASSLVNFGTPGYQNSNFIINQQGSDLISIENNTFSPDGDGFEDFLIINYSVNAPGYTGSFRVYDAEGRPIKSLKENALLQPEGFIKWDGTTNSGEKGRLGVYIIVAEVFNTNGEVKMNKQTCVLAGRL